ncbi:mCG140075 [Mus musculus]|uniref:Uncharacterized protein n=1 Tax=Mus musculus TaxID=10090 RepID=Q8CEM4_MOUSE|nr:mCG140075 [Mus musculus]BAC25561.1 unnamed protein product [Mus musculus]
MQAVRRWLRAGRISHLLAGAILGGNLRGRTRQKSPDCRRTHLGFLHFVARGFIAARLSFRARSTGQPQPGTHRSWSCGQGGHQGELADRAGCCCRRLRRSTKGLRRNSCMLAGVRGERGSLRARLTRRQVRQHGGHASGCHEHRGAGSRRVQKGSGVGVNCGVSAAP